MSFEAAQEFCKKEGNSFVMVKCFQCAPWSFSKQRNFFVWLFGDFSSNKKIEKNTIEFVYLGDG